MSGFLRILSIFITCTQTAVMNLAFATIFLTVASAELQQPAPNIEITKQWSLLAYNFPWDFPANDLEFYNPENVVATGIAVSDDRLFLATPRLFSGVPATISSVPRSNIGDSPILEAYPNWHYHGAGKKEYNCSEIGLVSVYRMKIDSCNRLWALDAGVSRSLEDFEVTCPPKILVIDLHTDQVVRRIDFPREVIRGETLYTNMVIDETRSKPENHCDDVYIYITDTVEPAIVVYDSGRDLTWRLSHPAMYPDPNFAQSNILGHRFTLMDGIVGMAFDAKAGIVYFQPLATDRLFSISTAALRAGPLPFGVELPVKLVGKKSSQGIGLEVSPVDGTIFFSPMTETAVAKWNPNTNHQRVLAYDVEQFQFVADMRIQARDPSSLYVLSSKFHRFFLKNLEPREVNTRILRIEGILPTKASPLISNHFGGYVAQAPTKAGTYLQNTYFSGTSQPYQYEAVGVINKAVRNPFSSLNTGERPEPVSHYRGEHTKYGLLGNENYYDAVNQGDFNGLRITKSVAYNTSTLHEN
ncbi:Major royal jelly protein 1 [Pseudolycoriella hygida]|uniref:Major royal jelly protein 1 n=1 Tax=Pseudolycoriella hygida TaxID=35572 RepID=A0A9Q0RZ20_9DIPT|nr:Major royal jelly protein 1 [Pseudolycoriella hygida]